MRIDWNEFLQSCVEEFDMGDKVIDTGEYPGLQSAEYKRNWRPGSGKLPTQEYWNKSEQEWLALNRMVGNDDKVQPMTLTELRRQASRREGRALPSFDPIVVGLFVIALLFGALILLNGGLP